MIDCITIDGNIIKYNHNYVEYENIFQTNKDFIVWAHFKNTIHENG